MASIDVFNRFFDGEEVLLSEMKEAVGEDQEAMLIRVLNFALITSLVSKVYAVGGQKRVLTGDGLAFYSLVKALWEVGDSV